MFQPIAHEKLADTAKLHFTCMADYNAARLEFIERNLVIAHLLLPAAEYLAIFATNPSVAIPNPGPAPEAAEAGNTAEERQLATQDFDRWKSLNALYKEQQQQLMGAKVDLIEIMPNDVKESLKEVTGTVSKGLLNKPAPILLKEIDALYNVITTETLKKVKSELPRKCNGDPKSIREVSVKYRTMFQLFATAGQPISQHDQVNMFSETLPPSFDIFFRFFDIKHPLVADKTFELLVKEALDESEKLAISANNVANVATTPAPAVTRAPHGGSVPTYNYCWSHGLVKSRKHNSASCIKKHPNHNVTATLNDKKGGKQTTWEECQVLGP